MFGVVFGRISNENFLDEEFLTAVIAVVPKNSEFSFKYREFIKLAPPNIAFDQ